MKDSKLKDILRLVFYPILAVRRLYNSKRELYLGKHNPVKLTSILYKRVMGYDLDWNNPIDINAKINWLKFYGDTSLWSICADKYGVREFVKQKGLSNILVELYGRYETAESIEWNKLPNKFVLKVNNGCGDVLICHDKSGLNKKDVVEKYKKYLQLKYWYKFAEPHYGEISPCIIIEELLDITKQDIKSTSLIDYKIWCFNGIPSYIFTCHNRSEHSVEVGLFDTDWNYLPEKLVKTKKFKEGKDIVPCPSNLKDMLDIASKLSVGFPQMRVDLYNVGGHIYLGELTMTSQSGLMNYFTKDFLNELGDLCVIM